MTDKEFLGLVPNQRIKCKANGLEGTVVDVKPLPPSSKVVRWETVTMYTVGEENIRNLEIIQD